MQTIIFTDNKRLSTDYCADKTYLFNNFCRLSAQKIDVNHILNTQVYQSHISRVIFWVIRTNISSGQNLIMQVCKNLVNRGSDSINFQFSITRIFDGQLTSLKQQKTAPKTNEKLMPGNTVSGSRKPSFLKTTQFPQFTPTLEKQSFTFNQKTNSSLEWMHNQNEVTEQSKKNHSNLLNIKQKQVSLKTERKKQFQVSSLGQLNAILMNKQALYEGFDLSEEILKKSKFIKSYVFRQNQMQIGVNVISQGCREHLQAAVNIQISQALNSRKQAYEKNSLTQDQPATFLPKPSTKLSQDNKKQVHHKILLFLFTNWDTDLQKVKTTSQCEGGNKEHSRFIQAIKQWRVKDQDINITQKLSKQYVLIKQEVQNQKSSFKNKLKIFQAIIGEGVNVQRLLNQQKQIQTASSVGFNSTNKSLIQVNGSVTNGNMRLGRQSELKSMLTQQQVNSSNNSTSNDSQFKRLKQSYQTIRNIDTVVSQQTKKIDNLNKNLKDIIMQKNQTLYKHAKSLNQVKKEIKNIKQQIQQKNIQFQFKNQKIEVEKVQKERNFTPTVQAEKILNRNVKLFAKIIQNEKINKNNQKYPIQEQDTVDYNKQNNTGISYQQTEKLSNDQKKCFLIRKQHKSIYKHNSPGIRQDNSTFIQFSETSVAQILKTISQSQRQKESKLLKKRQQQVENHKLQLSAQKQQNISTQPNDQPIQKQKQVLLSLYHYYLRNNELLSQVKSQLNSYRGFKNRRMDIRVNSNSQSQIVNTKQNGDWSWHDVKKKAQKLDQSQSQLNLLRKARLNVTNIINSQIFFPEINLDNYPVLNQILNPKVPESASQGQDCSIIQDSIQQFVIGKKHEAKPSDINNAKNKIFTKK